jgi:hypothetical protein
VPSGLGSGAFKPGVFLCAASALLSPFRLKKFVKPSSKCSMADFSATLVVLEDIVCCLTLGFCAGIESSGRDPSGFNDECLLAFCESRARLFEPLIEPEGMGPSLVDELSEPLSVGGCFDFLDMFRSLVAPPTVGLFFAGRLAMFVEVVTSRGKAFSRVDEG